MSASRVSVDPDWSLIARHLAGAATAGDEEALTAWIGDDLARRQLVSALRTAWVAAGAPDSAQGDPDQLWAKVQAHLPVVPPSAAASANPRDRAVSFRRIWPQGVGESSFHQRVWRSAAVAAVAVCAVCALTIGVAVGRVERWVSRSAATQDYVTRPGQRETVTLPDGSQFTLAPASRLRVAASYGRSSRELTLEGEAYFTVVHDAARPFQVRTANVVTTDMGTAFDVRSYADDSTVRVAVADGRVSLAASVPGVRGGPRSTALAVGDVATVSVGGGVSTAQVADLGPYVAWTRGELVFADVPLRDVLTALGRWYNLHVELSDSSLSRWPIRGTYTTESMTDVLTAVTSAAGAHYTRTGRTITVVAN